MRWNAIKGKSRKSGEPHIVHPIQVAGIFSQASSWMLLSPWFLHDRNVEDTAAHSGRSGYRFLVMMRVGDGASSFGKSNTSLNEEQLRKIIASKMLSAMSEDLSEVILVKCWLTVCIICVL